MLLSLLFFVLILCHSYLDHLFINRSKFPIKFHVQYNLFRQYRKRSKFLFSIFLRFCFCPEGFVSLTITLFEERIVQCTHLSNSQFVVTRFSHFTCWAPWNFLLFFGFLLIKFNEFSALRFVFKSPSTQTKLQRIKEELQVFVIVDVTETMVSWTGPLCPVYVYCILFCLREKENWKKNRKLYWDLLLNRALHCLEQIYF